MFDFFIIGLNYGALIGSILLSISSPNSIHSILNLINTFFAGTIFIVILKLIFFALVFLAVYLGAIIVLFLFIVMMLDIKATNEIFYMRDMWSFNDFFLLFLPIIWCDIENKNLDILNIYKSFLKEIRLQEEIFFSYDTDFYNFYEIINLNTQLFDIGHHMFEYLFIAFLLCGLLLFIAMIGAIVLTVESIRYKFLFQQDTGRQSIRNTSVFGTTTVFNNFLKN